MYTTVTVKVAKALLGCAVCSASFAANERAANNHGLTVAIRVSAAGLDLRRSADAQTFYVRLKNAAWVACTRGNRAGLEPIDDAIGCAEKSLAAAIQAAKTPALTRIYLETHSPRQAIAYGMALAAEVAVAASP